MDPQQLLRRSLRLRGQRVRRPAAFLARLGVMGLDQIDQCLPWHHCLHLREKLLPLGLLLGAVVSSSSEKPSYLPPINPVLACDYKAIVEWIAWVSQSLPSFPSPLRAFTPPLNRIDPRLVSAAPNEPPKILPPTPSKLSLRGSVFPVKLTSSPLIPSGFV